MHSTTKLVDSPLDVRTPLFDNIRSSDSIVRGDHVDGDIEAFFPALESLVGCRVVGIGRAVNIGIIEFGRSAEDVAGEAVTTGAVTELFRVHAQCPFRFVRGSQILLGSFDMHWPEDRALNGDVAFDTFRTMYERLACKLEGILAKGSVRVTGATLGAAGTIVLEMTDSVRLEVYPMSSGPSHEAWRLIDSRRNHFVYPEDFCQ
jgi:hypothetical protein